MDHSIPLPAYLSARGASGHEGPTRVLLAGDDDVLRETLARALRAEGYHVTEVLHETRSDTGLLSSFFPSEAEPPPELLITDVRVPGGRGAEVLAWLSAKDQDVPVILITSESSVASAREDPLLDVEDLVTAATLLAEPR